LTATRVRSGLEVLLEERRDLLRGRRFGLVCNPASVDAALRLSAERLGACGEGSLATLFGPEHGLTGEAQDMVAVEGGRDERTGLPVHSLYSSDEASLAPAREALEQLDLLLFDLQDVGARYYTFAATMGAVMEACAAARVPFVVLDRPNPIGGTVVEGNLVEEGVRSFVGRFPIPARHGMTVGEMARFVQRECGIGCDLTVVEMDGWRRELWFDETGLPWVAPSPNMPTLDTAIVYPGSCLIEGTNLSEGRGTTRPFEWTGAPFLDPYTFAEALDGERLPGVMFRPIRFTPTFHKWAGRSCGGVQIHVTERDAFLPYRTGLALLRAALRTGGEQFDWRREPYEFVSDRLAIDLLCGEDRTRPALERGAPLSEIAAGWPTALATFLPKRKASLLY
jgi:uncharacterized protein YbbC (DUF1343 family)